MISAASQHALNEGTATSVPPAVQEFLQQEEEQLQKFIAMEAAVDSNLQVKRMLVLLLVLRLVLLLVLRLVLLLLLLLVLVLVLVLVQLLLLVLTLFTAWAGSVGAPGG